MTPSSVPLSLETLAVSPADLLASLPSGYFGTASGVLVFRPNSQPDQILLIQRAAHDSHPHEWEVPGGAVDNTDSTFLDAAARELHEEAGLEAKGWIGLVGLGLGAIDGDSEIAKRGGYEFITSKGKRIIKFNVEAKIESEDVKLDPNEHQDWLWATKEEVENCKVGERKLVFTNEGQRRVILEGFRLREERKAGNAS